MAARTTTSPLDSHRQAWNSGELMKRSLRSVLIASLLVLGAGSALSAYAGSPAANEPSKPVGTTPDPAPLRQANQWLMTFRYQAGEVKLVRARRVRLPSPRVTPRHMGRYSVELLSGPTLVERLRFDFPLLGADELAGKHRPFNDPPRFERRAVVDYSVMLPDTPKASRARLVDRATGTVTMLPWPPQVALDAGAPMQDAGTEAQPSDAPTDVTTPDRGDAGAATDAPVAPEAAPSPDASAARPH